LPGNPPVVLAWAMDLPIEKVAAYQGYAHELSTAPTHYFVKHLVRHVHGGDKLNLAKTFQIAINPIKPWNRLSRFGADDKGMRSRSIKRCEIRTLKPALRSHTCSLVLT
jgi:hypothetical protein